MRCPYCGSPVELRSADGIYQDNRRGTWLYVCRNYPQCDAYVRVHAGTDIPVGTMAESCVPCARKPTAILTGCIRAAT